ncbi:AAA family ATPase [Patescibacteria group bacterium]
MRLKSLKIHGFKSFAKPVILGFSGSVSAIVGPNGSGKSNVAEAMAWVLGEQSIKTLRGKRGEDLIFNGSSATSKMGKASVSLVFEKSVDDEVHISRTVFRDGVNEYSINDTPSRLKDVVEFLSREGTGTLRHHIIRQGEADNILNSSPKYRREIIENSLGLKIYKLKKEEGERKLIKARENMTQVESLRKEIHPHIHFLKKQVKKAYQATELKEKLKELCFSYFSKAESFFEKELGEISKEKFELKKILEEATTKSKEKKEALNKLKKDKNERVFVSGRINELEREIGRYEGILSQPKEKPQINLREMASFIDFLEEELEKALEEVEVGKIRIILLEIKEKTKLFLKKDTGSEDFLTEIKKKHKKLIVELERVKKEEVQLTTESEKLSSMERTLYQDEIKINELKNIIQIKESREREINVRKNGLLQDKKEAEAILKEDIKLKKIEVDFEAGEAETERKEIERIKIKLEDSGGIGEEMIREYEEIKARDEFLVTELTDLKKSAESLRELIKQLENRLSADFKSGILKINNEFQRFFELMFDGGKAELKIKNLKFKTEDEYEELASEEGIDIFVSLPRKRISSLDMLSGGERALTSIALLFAVSQVNPPPFLILDETDAALDEANSRKYAEMLKKLSEQTQLVLITHNREIMGIAGVLYGVTMGSDSISRLLSVKLDKAKEVVI